jgi:3-hydroxybutyryl-CoA dehydrogenase
MESNAVRTVVVVGAGTMGHAIGQVFAQAGIEVNLVDTHETVLERAAISIRSDLKTLADHGRIETQDIPGILNHIHFFTDLSVAARDAGFAIEAVPESPDLKREIFSELEQSCPKGTVMASNTSGLDIFNIARVKDPSRLIVTHWFTPAQIIPLVEVVPGPETSPETTGFATALMEKIGKTAIVMKQFVPFFIVNRIQKAIGEAVSEILRNDWATPEEIDRAVKLSLGIRLPIVGVVQSMDFTGLDLIQSINRRDGVNFPLIDRLVAERHLGVKTSKGIYDYGGRSETEITGKRDTLLLDLLDHLQNAKAFEPL